MTDILSVFEREGIELVRLGKEYVGLCPLHGDRNPSLNVNPDKGLWVCRSCSKGGDAISFVMAYRGLSFTDAKKYMGLTEDPDSPEAILARLKARKRREFREWCESEQYRLINELLEVSEATRWYKDIAAMPHYLVELIRQDSKREYHLDILQGSNDSLKLALYREAMCRA